VEAHKLPQLPLHTRTMMRDGKLAFPGSRSLREAELDARREVGLIFRDKGRRAQGPGREVSQEGGESGHQGDAGRSAYREWRRSGSGRGHRARAARQGWFGDYRPGIGQARHVTIQ